jgi:hypothetical protein
MAVCTFCDQEMMDKVGCTVTRYEDEPNDRIVYGKESRFESPAYAWTDPCHDCGAPVGTLHHPGCDMEECPQCHAQCISCYCNDDEDW